MQKEVILENKIIYQEQSTTEIGALTRSEITVKEIWIWETFVIEVMTEMVVRIIIMIKIQIQTG